MYTYTHFQQGNKSQGAANQVYHKKEDSLSIQRFEDHRPESISQGKILKMITHSPRVKQMKRMQDIINGRPRVKENSYIPGNEIMQMRLLKKGEFNIAGEDHLESDLRRTDEEKFCIEIVGGKYWQEYQFMIDKEYGDPPELRSKWCLKRAIEKLMKATKSSETSSFLDLVKEAEIYNNNVEFEFGRVEENRINTSEIKELYTKIKGQADEIKAVIINIRDPEKKNTAKAQIEKLYSEVKDVKNNQNKTDKDERTIAMEKAFSKANEQHIIGVWKVGKDHIKSIDNDKITTSQQDFNVGYDEWKKKKEENNSQEVKKLPQQENP